MIDLTWGILNRINMGIILINSDYKVLIWNNWLEKYTGVLRKDILDKPVFEACPRFSIPIYREILSDTLEKSHSRFCSGGIHKYFVSSANGQSEKIRQSMSIEPVIAENEVFALIQINDITHHYSRVSLLKDMVKNLESEYEEIRVLQKMDRQLALHDALTGLPNRHLLMERLNWALADAKRNNTYVAVMFLDLDGFKDVNDNYGHIAGDVILKKVANKLKKIMRKTDTLARIGGDEFVVIMHQLTDIKNAEVLAKKLIKCFAEAFTTDNHEIDLGISVGISVYPDDSQDVNGLIKRADEAMYAIKKKGKNNYEFYNHDLKQKK